MGALVAFMEVQGGCSIPRVVNFIRTRMLVHSYKMYPVVRFSECQFIPVGWELHVCKEKIIARMNEMGQISWHVQASKGGA